MTLQTHAQQSPRSRRPWHGPRSLPTALARLNHAARFVLWRYGSTPNGKGKFPKVPFSPHKGANGKYHKADPTNPADWGTFEQCMAGAADWHGWFDGVGLVLLDGDVGIDLDDGVDPAHADALLKATRGRAYIERSVSRKGWHIILLGYIAEAVKTDTIEIYPGGSGRYFALGEELEGSTTPAPAQDVVDQAVTFSGTRPRTHRPSTFHTAETIALTPELASEEQEAHAREAELLRNLETNMTPQLANLLVRGIFPTAMKDTSASGARAVIVAQLHRAPRRRYTDAEIYVLARALWHQKGWEGAMAGCEKSLDKDARRLIAKERPGQAPQRQKRAYSAAPDPLVYLAHLAEEAIGGGVLLNRDQRAALIGCPRATAQRTEEKLVKLGYIELDTYALSGPGCKGRRGMIRITADGWRAIKHQDESVIFPTPAADDLVISTTPAVDDLVMYAASEHPKLQSNILMNTVFGDTPPSPRTTPPATTQTPTTHKPPCSCAPADTLQGEGSTASLTAPPPHPSAPAGPPQGSGDVLLMDPQTDAAPELEEHVKRGAEALAHAWAGKVVGSHWRAKSAKQTRFTGRDRQQLSAKYARRTRYGALPTSAPYHEPVRMVEETLPELPRSVPRGTSPPTADELIGRLKKQRDERHAGGP